MSPAIKPVLLATDSTCDLPVDRIAAGLNATCKTLRFAGRSTSIGLGTPPISNPKTYNTIRSITDPLLKTHSALVVATELPYDNAYFWDSDANTIIVSFAGWSSLTNLPRTNGLVGFVLSIVADEMMDQAPRHDENTGCVYDFLWDKTGIDMRLRGGALCRDCLARVQRVLSSTFALFQRSKTPVFRGFPRWTGGFVTTMDAFGTTKTSKTWAFRDSSTPKSAKVELRACADSTPRIADG